MFSTHNEMNGLHLPFIPSNVLSNQDESVINAWAKEVGTEGGDYQDNNTFIHIHTICIVCVAKVLRILKWLKLRPIEWEYGETISNGKL